MIRHVNLYKRFLVILLPAAFLIFLVLTNLYKVPLKWLEEWAGGVVYSAQEGMHTVAKGIGGIFTRYFFLVGLHDENALLKKEIDRLHGEINRLRETDARIKRLNRLLAFKQTSPLNFIPAEVIGGRAGSWADTLMINRGRLDGVEVNSGVITPRGVVGRVITTFPRHAQVLLITDTKSAIAAMVQRTREEGMLHGMGQGKAQMKYLPPVAKINKGDVLITSGLEGSFSKGLQIGRIKKIEIPEDDFFMKVTVTPEVPFSKLEEVLVLILPKEPLPETMTATPSAPETP